MLVAAYFKPPSTRTWREADDAGWALLVPTAADPDRLLPAVALVPEGEGLVAFVGAAGVNPSDGFRETMGFTLMVYRHSRPDRFFCVAFCTAHGTLCSHVFLSEQRRQRRVLLAAADSDGLLPSVALLLEDYGLVALLGTAGVNTAEARREGDHSAFVFYRELRRNRCFWRTLGTTYGTLDRWHVASSHQTWTAPERTTCNSKP